MTRVKGTPTETAMDLVTVTSDYIYLTRIGCGYDRKYNRTTKEITIDYDSNYIPPVEEPENTLTQGDITHEVGYTLDKRYSTSDGSLKVSTGKKTLALNKIEVEPGDTVRVKGLTYPTTAGDPVIATYKSDEAYIGGINICNAHKGQVAGTKVYFDFEDDLLTVTVGEGTACRYIGIGGYYTEPVTYRVTRNAEMR